MFGYVVYTIRTWSDAFRITPYGENNLLVNVRNFGLLVGAPAIFTFDFIKGDGEVLFV